MKQRLPLEFLEEMKQLLGDEYEAFLESYDEERKFGLRVNTAKLEPDRFEEISSFHLTPVPWISGGYSYLREDGASRHPFYFAGLYYLQEPSAMTPAELLDVRPGMRVLDLCAAPGGKATAIGAKLKGSGLLVANEISASRAKALLKNIELFGIPNSFVTNAPPVRLVPVFPEFFDRVLVDAPCSGEGMFRKDEDVIKAWTPEKPRDCAKIQKEIICQAADMLREGGELLYSTCTFAVEENEEVIAHLLRERPEMQVKQLPWREGFSHGKNGLEDCVRIWPHKMDGEGHFLALLVKGEKTDREYETKFSGQRPDWLRAAGGNRTGAAALEEFFRDVTMSFGKSVIEVRKDQVYAVPSDTCRVRGISFLRNGLYLGELKKDRFEPSQAFAMALRREEYASVLDFSQKDPRVEKYLRGETIDVDDLNPARNKGWQLVCVDGFPLGWGKLVNGTLKNKYHSGWRLK